MPIIHCKVNNQNECKKHVHPIPPIPISLEPIFNAVDEIKKQQDAEELANQIFNQKLKANHEAKLAELDKQQDLLRVEHEAKLAELHCIQEKLAQQKVNLESNGSLQDHKPEKQIMQLQEAKRVVQLIDSNEKKIASIKAKKKEAKKAQKFANLSAGKSSVSS